ncbi:MAG: GNAT family N-acetyltransferase [Candidatus Methanofastidiosia archaeon]
METEVTDTVHDIDEIEWEHLVGTTYLERSHAWLKTVEESGMRTMSYVLVREGGNLVAAAICFPYAEQLYSMSLPLLQVQCPLGTSLAFFSDNCEHSHALLHELQCIQNQKNTLGISIFDLRKNELTKIQSHIEGFSSVSQNDNTYITLDFNNFDDYLQSLGSSDRRSIRKTLNRAEKRWNITTVFTNEFSRWKDVTCRLQKYICEEHKNYRWYLSKKFYDALEKNLKDKAELMLCFKDDIPLAFGLVLNTPEVSLHKFIGVDPEYREYQAYFLLYYQGIKRALEKGQNRIYFGGTSYRFKEKIGCKREEILGLFKLKNPVFNAIVTSFIRVNDLLKQNPYINEMLQKIE